MAGFIATFGQLGSGEEQTATRKRNNTAINQSSLFLLVSWLNFVEGENINKILNIATVKIRLKDG